MASGRKRWAIRSTGSSFILLVLAIVAMIQIYPSLAFDPDEYVVKVEPGESAQFDLAEETLLTCLRVNEGASPASELRLESSNGSELPGRSPGFIESDRPGLDDQKIYSPVRIFDGIEEGAYTLHNDAESSILWLVDDGAMADDLYGNPWLYLFYVGCCLGLPIGLIGLVLAIMVWTDKRKLPDQFVIINDGRVLISEVDGADIVQEQQIGVPGPFVEGPVEENEERSGDSDKRWVEWDDG